METKHVGTLDSSMQGAIDELKALIQERYPQASFSLSRSAEEPSTLHLNTTVDVDDPDEILDVVMDRVLSLQDDAGLPVHVIPLRPIERVIQDVRTQAQSRPLLQRGHAGTPRSEASSR